MKYIGICVALYDYTAQNDEEELSFNVDDILYILENDDPSWFKAQLKMTHDPDGGPVGLIPSNYVEKTKSIGKVKALYDYKPQSDKEIEFKEDEEMVLYEDDDPNWFLVENLNGEIGLAPSNYIEKQQQQSSSSNTPSQMEPSVEASLNKIPKSPVSHVSSTTADTTKRPSTSEPKWAIVLYAFSPETPEETYLEEHTQVLVTKYTPGSDWWTIEHKDGKSGIVPAAYVKFQDEYEADLKQNDYDNQQKLASDTAATAAAAAKKAKEEKEEAERKRKEEERKKEYEVYEKQREAEEKEKARQAESERRRKMQEEAKQKELDAKKHAAIAAAAAASSPQIVPGSPYRSQIPAPPPPTNSVPAHNDPSKPDPSKVRIWTDRTGAFKVEAQFLSCSNGKIRLFKTNGVKIDVPMAKMCHADIQYIEEETNLKLAKDKTDNVPLAKLSGHSSKFTWKDYFKKINLPSKACVEYSETFEVNNLTEKDIDGLTYRKMKLLGMNERHIRRLQRFIETSHAEPPSEDENRPKIKGKKSVTFGAVSYIDDNFDVDDQENNVQWQIEQDEILAKQLQEHEQGAYSSGDSSHTGLHRKGTGRPTPSQSAPKDVNSFVLTPQQFRSEPLKPTVAVSTPPLQPQQAKPRETVASSPAVVPKHNTGFEDDAWAPRNSNSPQVQHPIINSAGSNNHITATPPPMPSRQRPTPQTPQQSMVDPQLLAKWGGSPALAAANSRPVPPVPMQSNSSNTANIPLNQPITLHHNASMNTLPSLQQSNNIGLGSLSNLHQQSASMSTLPSFQQQQQQQPLFQQPTNTGYNAPISSNFTPSLQPQAPTDFNNSSPAFQHTLQFNNSGNNNMQAGLSPALIPQMVNSNNTGYSSVSSVQSQMTGRTWATSTPDNPFGNALSGSSTSSSGAPFVPHYQQQTGFQPQVQQQQAQMSGSGFMGSPGYVQQQHVYNQYNSHVNVDPNDKYSVFKTIDTSSPSVFNNSNNSNNNQARSDNFYY